MSLPPGDLAFLQGRKGTYHLTTEAHMTCVVLEGFVLPVGYDRAKADLLLRLSPGYPDVPPDMWWFDPPVRLVDGRAAPATECMEFYLGHSWQRWSRHLQPGQWLSGIDSLESFLALIRRELEKSAPVTVR